MAAFDSATLEVLWTRLVSIVDEAAAALVRTSFSTVVRDSHDFSCVITDAAGRSLVQATDSIPSFIGTLPRTIRHFLDAFPAETLQPGNHTMHKRTICQTQVDVGRMGLIKALQLFKVFVVIVTCCRQLRCARCT